MRAKSALDWSQSKIFLVHIKFVQLLRVGLLLVYICIRGPTF